MREREHLKEEQVVPYLDGRLGAAERAAIEHHLAACAECRARIGELRAVYEVLGEWRAVEPSPAFLARMRTRLETEGEEQTRRWSWRWVYAGAAAVAAVILLVVLVQPPQSPPAGQGTQTAETPEDDLAVVEPVVLENYDLLREFDILFDSAEKKETARPQRET